MKNNLQARKEIINNQCAKGDISIIKKKLKLI